MRTIGAKLAALIFAATAIPAEAAHFREGVIATSGTDGKEKLSFALVRCNGKLMFDRGKSNPLLGIRWLEDGSLRVDVNSNRAVLTLYEDGRLINPKGKLLHWRMIPAKKLSGKPKKRFANAREKCR